MLQDFQHLRRQFLHSSHQPNVNSESPSAGRLVQPNVSISVHTWSSKSCRLSSMPAKNSPNKVSTATDSTTRVTVPLKI